LSDGHALQDADRFASTRAWRAAATRDIKSAGTASPVVRKKSCREWFKPVLVMETGEHWFRDNPMSLRDVVADRSCHGHSGRLGNPRTEARVRRPRLS
jgi:hypothetical protein